MAEDLNFPVAIELAPTVREADGLAMSSRNAYLSAEQRRQAPALWRSLQMAAKMVMEKRPSAADVVEAIRTYLAEHAPEGVVDYIEAVDPEELSPVDSTDGRVLIALAVKFDLARLIDNVLVDSASPGS